MQLLWRKHPGIIATVIIIVLALVYGFWPEPIIVDAATVSRGPLAVTVEQEGRTRVKDFYIVSAPVTGVASRVNLDVGDTVEQGELLVSIKPVHSQVLDARARSEAKARIEAAQAALRAAEENAAAARADEEFALTEVERSRKLAKDNLVSRAQLDQAETRLRTARAAYQSALSSVDVARYQLQAARTALDYSEGGGSEEIVPVTSPITGKVLEILHKCEGVVNAGVPLIKVGDPGKLEVEVDVLSADAVKIKPGTPVNFLHWGGEQPLQGVVHTVEPVAFTKVSALGVEEQRVWVIVDFTGPKERWQPLGHGYRVDASFILWQQDDTLQIPASALFRVNDDRAVFVIDDGRARLRPVTTGRRTGLAAQVLEGLSEGEQVIVHPDDLIEDGSRIRLRK